MSEEARRLLGTVWVPEGEVMRLLRSPGAEPGADGPQTLVFGHGRGEGADQIVQHAGRQVLRIDPVVLRDFDGASVEVVDGPLGVVPPAPLPADDGS